MMDIYALIGSAVSLGLHSWRDGCPRCAELVAKESRHKLLNGTYDRAPAAASFSVSIEALPHHQLSL